MNQLLAKGDKVFTEGGKSCIIEDFIGGGGQGEVYLGNLDGEQVAVKWYFPHYLQEDSTLRRRLERAIEKGAPGRRFLWPEDLVFDVAEHHSFGYIMPLREKRFRGISGLMSRTVETSFRALARGGFELADSLLQLHAQGFCYRDISFGNVFFDPLTGETLICDNDNVDVDGEDSGILGTPRFIAPEVVRGEAMPNIQSDRFSLATLLFYMLMIHHPLEGRREYEIHALDLAAMNRLYGTEPVFIFDPVDDSNRPVEGIHDNARIFWGIYPEFLRRRFVGAFTDGIRDPKGGRVRESVWQGDMVRLHASVFSCQKCGEEVFYDSETLQKTQQLKPCWSCGVALQLPWRIRLSNKSLLTFVGSDVAILDLGAKLYPHHVDPEADFSFEIPVAEVVQNPKNPEILGLKNLSKKSWFGQKESGELREVEPGQSIAMRSNLRVNFGKATGDLRR